MQSHSEIPNPNESYKIKALKDFIALCQREKLKRKQSCQEKFEALNITYETFKKLQSAPDDLVADIDAIKNKIEGLSCIITKTLPEAPVYIIEANSDLFDFATVKEILNHSSRHPTTNCTFSYDDLVIARAKRNEILDLLEQYEAKLSRLSQCLNKTHGKEKVDRTEPVKSRLSGLEGMLNGISNQLLAMRRVKAEKIQSLNLQDSREVYAQFVNNNEGEKEAEPVSQSRHSTSLDFHNHRQVHARFLNGNVIESVSLYRCKLHVFLASELVQLIDEIVNHLPVQQDKEDIDDTLSQYKQCIKALEYDVDMISSTSWSNTRVQEKRIDQNRNNCHDLTKQIFLWSEDLFENLQVDLFGVICNEYSNHLARINNFYGQSEDIAAEAEKIHDTFYLDFLHTLNEIPDRNADLDVIDMFAGMESTRKFMQNGSHLYVLQYEARANLLVAHLSLVSRLLYSDACSFHEENKESYHGDINKLIKGIANFKRHLEFAKKNFSSTATNLVATAYDKLTQVIFNFLTSVLDHEEKLLSDKKQRLIEILFNQHANVLSLIDEMQPTDRKAMQNMLAGDEFDKAFMDALNGVESFEDRVVSSPDNDESIAAAAVAAAAVDEEASDRPRCRVM